MFTPKATIFVIFGLAGDLSWRKLCPALFNLYLDGRIPEKFAIIGTGRSKQDSKTLLKHLADGVKQFSRQAVDPKKWEEFSKAIQYEQLDLKDPAAYEHLAERIDQIEKGWKTVKETEEIFYMATPPASFGQIAQMLGKAGLSKNREHSRLVLEKPIGHDLESAIQLNKDLQAHFHESQIYRIDHYLAKETVQNILAFRFANPMYEPIWNRHYVDHVTITVAEDIGIEDRADYYDHAGALRDMVQNHILQLLCLVGMEPPISFNADEVRNKKVDVLNAIRPIDEKNAYQVAVRGQYNSGWVHGKEAEAYRDEADVAPGSHTETFAAVKLFVDNWRWRDVPFYLRTGKRLPEKVSEISIRFREVPHQAFPSSATLGYQPGRLVICIQPTEGMVLKFHAKQPGQELRIVPVDMHFCYNEAFHQPSPEAYETLLWDVMEGDATLFMRADQVEAAWKVVMPILNFWEANPPIDFPNYNAGTWGPQTAEGLIAADGRYWLSPTSMSGCFPSSVEEKTAEKLSSSMNKSKKAATTKKNEEPKEAPPKEASPV
jgi:glucose-6-phosphate 1-dehydrogenase